RAVDDHRPEQAWKQSEAAASPRASGAFGAPKRDAKTPPVQAMKSPRPLWLLRTPRTLHSQDGQPICQGGRLRLIAGPERIESGWWDGQSARRDYYVARNGKGETFWIYLDHRRSKDWYLHGIFS
ncbi:MAG: hypothetical protein SV422_06350, partial [Pseudomonadota bacterium]|nr:hypothetical protein [Pseudomonadota bacterium]